MSAEAPCHLPWRHHCPPRYSFSVIWFTESDAVFPIIANMAFFGFKIGWPSSPTRRESPSTRQIMKKAIFEPGRCGIFRGCSGIDVTFRVFGQTRGLTGILFFLINFVTPLNTSWPQNEYIDGDWNCCTILSTYQCYEFLNIPGKTGVRKLNFCDFDKW